jgi:RHS repeat-associated protein
MALFMRESGTSDRLDYFNARYFSPAQGSFTSPDPGSAGANPLDPQSWNGYAYVGNRPLMYTDPSGQFLEATAVGSSVGGPIGAGIGAAIDIGLALFGIFGGGGGSPPDWSGTASPPSSVQTTTSFDSGLGDEVGGIGALLGLGFQASGPTPPPGYQACPPVRFVITGVGPRPQAPGDGAFTGRPPGVGQVAIEPRNFGIPYDTQAEREAAQRRAVASVVRRIRIYPNFGTNTAPLPRGTRQTPRGLPSRGPYSPVDTINPRPSGNQIDLYRYGTMRNGRASTKITMPTIFIPINNVGVRCPQ